MIVAGEISGDLYGSDLILHLRREMPAAELFGAGGPKMKAAGMDLLYDTSGWGTIGMVEAVKKLPRLYFAYRRLRRAISERRPDALILIDYPGMNMRLARAARAEGIPVVYYFPPSKWVKDPRCVADAARTIDFVAAPFISTAKLYRDAGARVEFVGNPLLDIVRASGTRSELAARFGTEGKSVVALLPGSREREIQYMLPLLLETARELARVRPDDVYLMPVTSAAFDRTGLGPEFFHQAIRRDGAPVRLVIDQTYDIMALANVAVITSGTATLEAACLQCPMVIVYQVSKITEWVARCISSLPDHFGMPNLILGRRIIPELIQEQVTPENVVHECRKILEDEETGKQVARDLQQVVRYLGRPGAGARLAQRIHEMIKIEREKDATG